MSIHYYYLGILNNTKAIFFIAFFHFLHYSFYPADIFCYFYANHFFSFLAKHFLSFFATKIFFIVFPNHFLSIISLIFPKPSRKEVMVHLVFLIDNGITCGCIKSTYIHGFIISCCNKLSIQHIHQFKC